jgi:hypothetical protein
MLIYPLVCLIYLLINSHDPKGHVSYCYHWASVVSLTFCILIKSPNFGRMVLGWSLFRIPPSPPTKMAAMTKNRKFGKKSLKSYPLWICRANWAHTMVEWSSDDSFENCVQRPRPPTKITAITKNRKFAKKQLKNFLLWNYRANWAQTMVEWSLGGHLSELCPMTPAVNQDGHHY